MGGTLTKSCRVVLEASTPWFSFGRLCGLERGGCCRGGSPSTLLGPEATGLGSSPLWGWFGWWVFLVVSAGHRVVVIPVGWVFLRGGLLVLVAVGCLVGSSVA